MYQPRHQDWYGSLPDGREARRRLRLLASLALQSRRGRGRQERLPLGFEGTQLGRLPEVHHGRGALQLAREDLPRGGQGTVRQDRAIRKAPL